MRRLRATLLFLSLALAGQALAEDKAAAPATGGAKKKKVIRLDAITVEGRIQKPQAFYMLQRSTLNFDELNRGETFIPKVEKSVDRDAF
ncbi:MAG: hypothetical protein LUQ69_10585 [Methanoregulaceae archaeon]|nr:hypothetical protein [Methanoregulaceae archaeon]